MQLSQDVLKRPKVLAYYTRKQLQWEDISLLDAVDLIGSTHLQTKTFIPGQMELYCLNHRSRFRRLFEQFVILKRTQLASQ